MEIRTPSSTGGLYLKCTEPTTLAFVGAEVVWQTKEWDDGPKTRGVAQVAVIHDDGTVSAHLLDRSPRFWQDVAESKKVSGWAWIVQRTGTGRFGTKHTAVPVRRLTADELMAIAQLQLPEIRGGSDE